MDEIIKYLKDILLGEDKLYMGFAVLGTIVFLIQLIISLFLGSSDIDMNSDVDADGNLDFSETIDSDSGLGDIKFFSFRSIVAFIMFFGWGGLIASKHVEGEFACFSIAFASGLVMMFLTALMLYFLLKLQHSGNMQTADYIGCTGTVYLRIPGGRSEIGKVTASVKGTHQEIIAVADEDIGHGVSVEIIQKIDGRRFLVKKI